ncbi:energy-coupling factor transporter transmembrane component T [Stagnihabitans tardus]|uniref:Energy-coupling factor transporter transmembrane protein EcfT n=1 Tax=Stagnihabitans tardus TaxID=2699202 RepID=A0AAE5BV84_9RHOB|nr:energy-coupling factor transporter transmembrane component T [Stagnihabitans tardus]NBZ86973.1 energy-coupling factor transporter transmembrane protein EcfT [Stagnihabitans tardus]
MLTLTSSRQTWAHDWPAGVKLGLLVLFTLILFALPGVTLTALGLALPLALATALGLVGDWLRLLRPLLWVGAVILAWHGFRGTPEPGVIAVLRMVAALGAANLVTMTTRLSDMQAVFLWLARPLSPLVPPARLALAMALMIRFLPVLSLRAEQLSQAWAARSRRRIGWALVFAVTLAALDDAEHVAEALRARGGVG